MLKRTSILALLVAAAGLNTPVFGQAVNSEQLLSIFNNLPADQQQQILQQLGGAAPGAGNTQNAGRSNGNAPAMTDDQRRRDAGNPPSDATVPFTLQPGDTVLIDAERMGQRVITQPVAPAQVTAAQAGAAAAGQQPTGAPVATMTVPAPQLSATESEQLDRLITLLRDRNPYTLDRNGNLLLPGFPGIPLSGLSEQLASRRLAAEPTLRNVAITLTRLPVLKTGDAALQPYGYELFSGGPTTFAPLSDLPVPSGYIVGPGDQLSVQLYGSQNRTSRLTVGRDGTVSFPELGPIGVGGRSFTEVRNDIEGRVSRQMIGVRASVSMGETRAIQVFVLGEAKYPGSYTVSGLSTITSALYASGGIKPIGSLRGIQLKRQGRVVRELDLYDLLMRGDTSNDASLLPGDAIFIPPVGATVSVDGEVQRPAIYELKGAGTATELIAMAGGFTSEADTARAALTRVDDQQQRVVLNVNPQAPAVNAQALRRGDALRVARLRPTLDSGVSVRGEVFRPGNFAWRAGLRLTDVIGSVGELKPGADAHYVLIRRELAPDRRIAVVSADLIAALSSPASASNVALEAHDQILVFDSGLGRERVIKPLMDEIRVQANLATPAQLVNISGRVKVPGDYPLEGGMRIADLIRAGGSLEDAAYGGTAELSRYVIENGQTRRTQVLQVDLAAVLRGDPAANVPLQPFDTLYIKEISGWSQQEQVSLRGEVRFPGVYPIKRGETLRSVIERAGGLTDLAFAEGAVFTRAELKLREQEQLDRLAEHMRTDLVSLSLMAARANQAGATQTYSIGQTLLDQLKAAKAVGRLVIDLAAAEKATPGSASDIVLRNGDELTVPKTRQEVTVMGEVQNVTSHLYAYGQTRDDYVALSGGTTRQADRGRIYVVRADGSVVSSGSGWLFRSTSPAVHAGDTIVVPLDTERMPTLPFWQAVTQILYNLAISAAAVNSF